MFHDMYIYDYLWYVDTRKLCKLRLLLNSSAICRENRYINVEFIWDMCKYTNNVVVWCLYKCQTVDWMVIYLFYMMHWIGKYFNFFKWSANGSNVRNPVLAADTG